MEYWKGMPKFYSIRKAFMQKLFKILANYSNKLKIIVI